MEPDSKFFLLSRRFWTVAGIPVILGLVELIRWFFPQLNLPSHEQAQALALRAVDAGLTLAEYGSPLVAGWAWYRHRTKPDIPHTRAALPLTIRPWKPRVPGPK